MRLKLIETNNLTTRNKTILCKHHRAMFVDIMTHLGPCALYPALPVGCMMKRHQACWRQDGTVMAWWPFIIRPTTSEMLRARTSCLARACRRTPMPTLWLMRSITVSWPQGSLDGGMNHSIRTGPSGYVYTYWQERAAPCYVYLKCTWQTRVSTQSHCTGEWHSLSTCLPACQPTSNMVTSITRNGASSGSKYETHDLQPQWPFCMLLNGCSGSGKSTLTT